MASGKIFQKIKKLLALANDNGASEAEAQTAMQLAHDILAKHNLSLAEVNAHQGHSEITEERVSDFSPTAWKGMIWDSTCKLYFCRHLFSDFTFRKGVVRFIYGKPDNVKTTKLMAAYFIKTVKKIADRECEGFGRTYKKDFLQGCAWRLASKIENLRSSKKKQQSTGTGLMVIYEANERLIDEFLKDTKIETTCRKEPDISEAFAQGWRQAESIPVEEHGSACLNPQLAISK